MKATCRLYRKSPDKYNKLMLNRRGNLTPGPVFRCHSMTIFNLHMYMYCTAKRFFTSRRGKEEYKGFRQLKIFHTRRSIISEKLG
jgi:hypothetical protein